MNLLVYLLDVSSRNKVTKNSANLYVPVLRADKIGLSCRTLLTSGLSILDKPYETPGCKPYGYKFCIFPLQVIS